MAVGFMQAKNRAEFVQRIVEKARRHKSGDEPQCIKLKAGGITPAELKRALQNARVHCNQVADATYVYGLVDAQQDDAYSRVAEDLASV
jgi:hypothetical protein